MESLKQEAEKILNCLERAKTDDDFYDLGERCDQLWKKHHAIDMPPNSDSYDGLFSLSDCMTYCNSVPDNNNQEDRDENHKDAIRCIKIYIKSFN